MIDAPVIAATARNKRATKSKPFIIHQVFLVEIGRGFSTSPMMVDRSTQKERWVSRVLATRKQ